MSSFWFETKSNSSNTNQCIQYQNHKYFLNSIILIRFDKSAPPLKKISTQSIIEANKYLPLNLSTLSPILLILWLNISYLSTNNHPRTSLNRRNNTRRNVAAILQCFRKSLHTNTAYKGAKRGITRYYCSLICQDLGQNSNYISKAYDILDDKICYFLDICYIVAIKQLQIHTMFSSILSGQVKNYFVYNVNRNLPFAKMYIMIKMKFDIEVNKTQYHTDWNLMIYSTLNVEKSNIGKINLEVLQALLDKL